MSFDVELQQLTMVIWDSILRLPIEVDSFALTTGEQTMSACVHITGQWRGAVALSCAKGLAAQAASVMFGIDAANASRCDMQDALGELVNMLGGNVKALMPGPSHLSLPSVVDGSDYTVRVPGSRLLSRVPLRSGEHALSVSLLEREEMPGGMKRLKSTT